jgi:small subunit ribosomal protein S3
VGQKVHPGGMRVGVIHDWKSNWWTGKKEFPQYLVEDVRIREHIYKKLAHAGLSDILIRKDKQRITVDIYTARPGIVIGKSGVEVDALRKELHAITNKNVHININEIKRPELDAKLVAQSIAEQLQNRVSFRRAMKRSLASAMRSGAQGIRIRCAGRLGGGEMSRAESYSEGRVPLHTIRADIDYGFTEAKTTFGRIGVKVWINKGEIMPEGFGATAADTRALGDQDQARRRGGVTEGLGASRERGAGRGGDREGLGPVRQRRRGEGGGRGGGGGGHPGQRTRGGQSRGRARAQEAPRGEDTRGKENVERPRTDEQAKSAEGREQPVIEPQVETTPAPVADAPDTTTPKQQTEDATKREKSTDAKKTARRTQKKKEGS